MMWVRTVCFFLLAAGAGAGAGEALALPAGAGSGGAPVDGIAEETRDGTTRVTLEGIVGRGGYVYSVLASPPRLVVDIREPERVLSADRVPLEGEAFTRMRVGRYPDKMRLVFDFRGAADPDPLVTARDGALVVVSPGAAPPQPVAPGMGGPETPEPPATPVNVEAVDFQYAPDASTVVIKLDEPQAPYRVDERTDRIVVRLPGAVIPNHLLRPMDTKGFSSAVYSIVPERGEGDGGPEATVTLLVRGKPAYTADREGESLRIRVVNPPQPAAAAARLPPPDLSAAETTRVAAGAAAAPAAPQAPAVQVAAPAPAAPAAAAAPKPEEPGSRLPPRAYQGKKISLDFKDADIQNVLRLIAEVSGKNIVISDAVQGKVTIRLMNTPWDMALDVILKTYGLDKEELGPDILRVAPYKTLQEERQARSQAAAALVAAEPLVTEVVTLNYAKAENLQGLLTNMRSNRGNIMVDGRTNSLVIKDVSEAIREMVDLVQNLDRQTPQVLIEAKIVELEVDFERALGIQWGTAYKAGPATGNPTGLNFPGTASVGGAADNVSGESPAGISSPVVNLPAAIDSSAGGALGFSLASITNSFRLDAQLSALEKKKHARILSSPRVATLNNQEAWIQQGEEIPYQTTSDEGTKTEFKDATLRLSVTPQINADRSIVMKIKVNKDTALQEVTAGIVIGKKEAVTVVLVNSGETAVIGGIYTNDEQRNAGGVPWFMDIPGLGYLFKNQSSQKKRTELMIFITPRIIPVRSVPVEQWVP